MSPQHDACPGSHHGMDIQQLLLRLPTPQQRQPDALCPAWLHALLTPVVCGAGQERVPEVLALVFAYLRTLNGPEGVSHRIYEEGQALAALRFRFADKISPYNLAQGLAGALQLYDDK